MVTVPTLEEARQILQDLYPEKEITDRMAEKARDRLAIDLNPFGPERGDELNDRMIKKLVDHTDKIEKLIAKVQELEARIEILEGP